MPVLVERDLTGEMNCSPAVKSNSSSSRSSNSPQASRKAHENAKAFISNMLRQFALARTRAHGYAEGPFQGGGYYLILANDQPEAVAIAARHSGARVGSVEVRQVFELPSSH